MKRLLSLMVVLAMLFTMIPVLTHAEGLTDKLLAKYDFNDGTTNDGAGSNDAVFYNGGDPAAASFTDGISGKALQLSTKDTDQKYWLSIPMSALAGKDSFTISMWYNQTGKNTSGEDSELFSFYNSSAEKFIYYTTATTGGNNGFTMKWAGSGTYGYANSYGFSYTENEWVHLIYAVDVVDGQAAITVYRNGAKVGTEQGGSWAGGLLSELGINNFTVGGKNPYKGGATPKCLFYGAVDEIELYNGALTADEAGALYESERPALPRGTLLAEYNFDNETTRDSVGSKHASFYNNAEAATASYINGFSGKALQLSTKGTDEKYWLSIPMDVLAYSPNSFTLSMWYNQTAKNTEGEDSELFSLYNSGAEKFLYYSTAGTGMDNGFTMKWDGTYGFANSYGFPYVENDWINLTYVVDVVDGKTAITVYRNGAVVGTDQGGAWDNSLLTELGINTFTVGGKNPHKGGATPKCLFYGAVDEIKLYAGALTAEEIQINYAAATAVDHGDLLARYTFDDETTDDSLGEHDAVFYNNAETAAASYVSGVSGKALQLSTKGTGEKYWLSIPMGALKSQDSFTLAMWYNQTAKNTEGEDSELFSFYNKSEEKFLYYTTATTGNNNGFTMKWDGNFGFANSYGFPYAENEWTHLTFTVDVVDGQAVITVYRNGEKVDTEQGENWTNGLLSQLGVTDFTIGGKNPYKGGPTPNCLFYGAVDEIELYAGALTDTEVQKIYEKSQPTDPGEDGALKVLFIANSFGDDTTYYLYDILSSLTDFDIKVGCLYIGGCNIDTHYLNATEDRAAYEYRVFSKETGGKLQNTPNVSIKTAIESDHWDFITLQQASGGIIYPENNIKVQPLIDRVKEMCENSGSNPTLLWNMTWAYPNGIAEPFAWWDAWMDCDKDQLTMYSKLVAATQEEILTKPDIKAIIPNATSIQNARTSFLGDTLNRDQLHLGYLDNGLPGRYIAALTAAGTILGEQIPESVYVPENVDAHMKAIALESANNALQTPYGVTDSAYPTLPTVEDGQLLAKYSFDDETTNDSVDGRNATLFNSWDPAEGTYEEGVAGKALKLSTQGTDEKFWLNVPNYIFTNNRDTFSISLWYKATGYNASGEDSELFSFYNSKRDTMLFYSPAATGFQDKGFTFKWDGNYGYANVMTPYARNQWVHLVYVISGEGNQSKITAYVNGKAVEVDQGGNWENSLMSQLGIDTFTIGGKNPYKGGNTPNCLFYGSIDEVGIYAGALTEEDAQRLYAEGSIPEEPPIECGTLLAEYNFDDETTKDNIGANDATLFDNAAPAEAAYVDGQVGKALQLSTKGEAQKLWLSVPYSTLKGSEDEFTLTLWYKATDYNTSGEDSELFSFYNSGAEKFLFYSPAATGFQDKGFTMKWDGSYGFANVISPYEQNEWKHLAFCVGKDGTKSVITAYVDGKEVYVDQGGEWENSLMSLLGVDTFTIGGKNPYKGGATPNCLFYGQVDEIRLYAGVLTAEEVAELVPAVEPDKAALTAAIAAAEAIERDKYTEESLAALDEALAAAKAVAEKEDATQEEIAAALAALNAAVEALAEKPVEPPAVDKTVLTAAITAAEAIERDKYTDESLAALDEALAAAKAAAEKEDATQEEIDAAAAALNAAVEALDEKPIEPPAPENPFEDVHESDWFFNAVLWAISQDPPVTNGKTATTFAPTDTCTRAEVVQFLWNAAGKPAAEAAENPFDDVKDSDWFYNAVMWAVANGITNGKTATTFAPTDTCTRAEVVQFLRNAAGKPDPTKTDNPFEDVRDGDWFYASVLWAVEKGITAGTSPKTFEPTKTCTRAEVVQFLMKAASVSETPNPDPNPDPDELPPVPAN